MNLSLWKDWVEGFEAHFHTRKDPRSEKVNKQKERETLGDTGDTGGAGQRGGSISRWVTSPQHLFRTKLTESFSSPLKGGLLLFSAPSQPQQDISTTDFKFAKVEGHPPSSHHLVSLIFFLNFFFFQDLFSLNTSGRETYILRRNL